MDRQLQQLLRDFEDNKATIEEVNTALARAGRERLKPKINLWELYKFPEDYEYPDYRYDDPGKFEHIEIGIVGAEMLDYGSSGDYQGSHFAIFKFGKIFFAVQSYYGSCDYCDGWMGLDRDEKVEYAKDLLKEGNTRSFFSLQDMKNYVETTEDYAWLQVKTKALKSINELINNG